MSERSGQSDDHSVSHAHASEEQQRAGGVGILAPLDAGASDVDELVPVGEVPQPLPPQDIGHNEPAERLNTPMPTDRLRGWLVTLALTLVAGVVRFWNLGFPTDKGTPIFDEKHYVPQAWQVLRNGGYEDNPGYEVVVHPPLGKQLIAIGEAIFGYNGWGWRFTAAIAGTLCVLLIIRITRRMTRSTLLGAIAGLLLICDGVSHVSSRVGMLDIFQVLFVVAAFGALVVDRDQGRDRLAAAMRAGTLGNSAFGPWLGVRWWRITAGVCLGLCCGAKWSGLSFIAAFALLALLWDESARRKAGVRQPLTGVLVRDVPEALLYFAVLPVAVYLATWWAWFASETAIDRHAVGKNIGTTSTFWFVPDALRSLWYYSGNVLNFHTNLLTPRDHPHPWESKPWTWPMGLRPMLYYYESGAAAPGCGQADCVGALMLVGTPAMWWLAFPMLAWSVWRALTRLDWRYAAMLVGYGAAWLPWFLKIDRQMYFFYAAVMAPFLVLGLTLVLGEVLGRVREGFERRGTGLLVVALYVGLVVANFAWLWPILNGDSITPWRWQAELWLPSWR